ncbi:MAG: hypothetical protein KC619_12740 [Myxococcales bacterium]|nr:hypothetical protein [Myxococcales bacterium]
MERGLRRRAELAASIIVGLTLTGCVLSRSGTGRSCSADSECEAGERCVGGVCTLGSDAGIDGGSDAGTEDGGPDAGFDGGLDAGFDAGTDAGSDAGFDAGGILDDPRTISGLVLWLHADGLTAGELARWPDSSGGGHDAVAVRTAPSVATEMGRTVVRYDGAGHFITDPFAWGDGATIFLVARVDPASQYNTRLLHSDDASDHFALQRSRGTTLEIFVAGDRASGPFPSDDAFHLIEIAADASVELFSDEAPVASVARSIPRLTRAMGIGGNPVTILGGSELTGAIAELLVWDEPLTPSDRARVVAYLRARWAPLL